MILALLSLLAAVTAKTAAVVGHAPPGTVVFLAVSVSELPPPAASASLHLGIQDGKVMPRVSAAQLGSSLRITLLDTVFADLSVYHGLSEVAFHRKFVVPGDTSLTKLERPGLMTIENENSPTERFYVYVTPTASFVVAGADGRYRLENVPPGKRRITAWDEKNGTQDKEVEVPKSGEVGLDFGK